MLPHLTCFSFTGNLFMHFWLFNMDYTMLNLFIVVFDRWDYSNLGYLDALKHLTDLKEEGMSAFINLIVTIMGASLLD